MTEWYSPGLIETAMAQVRNSVVITDADFSDEGPHVVVCNQSFLNMTGYEFDEIVGRNLRILQGPDTDPEVLARLRDALARNVYFEGQTVNYRKDGTPYIVRWSISPVRDESGRVTHYASVQQDVTAQVRLAAERDMLAEALETVADPIMITDTDHRILYVNKAFERILGHPSEDIVGRTPWPLYEGTESESSYAEITASLERHEPVHGRVTIRTRDGRLLHTLHTVTPNRADDSGARRNISTFHDITELVEAAEELRVRASTDALTGLRNRRAGESILRAQLRELPKSDRRLSVALCDIDHFKRINDTYGHAVGDRVLQQVAAQLDTLVRGGDVAVRWGGEEFLLIMPGATLDPAVGAAERVRAALEASPDAEVGAVTISIGVSEARPEDTVESLLERADQALYAAKANGRNRVECR